MSEEIKENSKTGQEIDLIAIIKTIWAKKKFILKSTCICVLIGFLFAIGTPKEYESEVKLLTEMNTGTSTISSLIQQFGGIAGLNLAGSKREEALTPLIYPDVIFSTPFMLEVLSQKVYCSKIDSSILLSDFLEKYTKTSLSETMLKYTVGLPFTIRQWIKGNKKSSISKSSFNDTTILQLTDKQRNQIRALSHMLILENDDETNILTFKVSTQDPYVSAEIVNKMYVLLTKYIIDYKIQKAKLDLKFIEDRFAETERRYLAAQKNLADFKDQNKGLILASVLVKEQNLQSEYNLAFNMYNTLSQQVEQSKIKVQEKTPVFKVINPSQIANTNSKPKLINTLFIMAILGAFIGMIIITINNILKENRKILL
jgi:uncharacterized protein involved in exopolysaccharide biosynthesis